jgi:thioredoxin 1
MSENVVEINDSNFETEVLQTQKPVLVDFWAPWCGACIAMEPLIQRLAGAFYKKIKFTKCHVGDSPATPAKYGIKSIPALIFFKEGKKVDQITGIVGKSKLEETINSIL